MDFYNLISKIRPAPLQVFIASITGLNSRREVAFEDLKFFVDPMSDFGSGIIRGSYEPAMIATLKRYLGPGAVFLDLGANEGIFTVTASRIVGPQGRVVAVEPQQRLMPYIEKNLELNGCTNCKIVQCVVGNKTGIEKIFISPSNNTGSTSLFRNTRYATKSESVQSFTLADLLVHENLQTADLVKIDIEGAEYDTIMSAEDVLKSGRLRNIALEYHPSVFAARGISMSEVHNLLLSCGYFLRDELGNSVYEFAEA